MAAIAHAASIKDVAAEACPYPTHLLPRGGTGLCLFAAGFLGQNDAIHMANAGMDVHLVDTDEDRLMEMAALYPDDWQTSVCDAWAFAEKWSPVMRPDGYDVVSVDNFTGETEQPVMDSLPLWCSLARRLVTVTHTRRSTYCVPEGWRGTVMRRSPLANWLVLERA